MESLVELLAAGGIGVLLVGSVVAGWREGVFADPEARRAGIAGGVTALLAMAVNELYVLPWPVEAAFVLVAALAVSLGVRRRDRLRDAVGVR
ncbi:hypothetical protein [Halosimplex salinum]|uniref:hypothetical protein n=1 Tax=Halosimplex salinum TaxID=1710538 RepID=UPI000F4768CF|nr:hypothetical protein [Halosimplex salinum]